MSSSKRRKLNTEETPQPMSAFALRKKLLAQQSQDTAGPVDQANLTAIPSPLDANQTVANLRKKARKIKTAQNTPIERDETSLRQSESLPAESSIELPNPNSSRADQAANRLSPFSLTSESEQDSNTSNQIQPVSLSSFRPSKSNFQRKINGILQLKLIEGERLVILGSYGIQVRSGEVTICGAVMKASESISWVHAPQSHALPVIRCAGNSILSLHPHPENHELKELGLLSPLLGKLWWERPSSSPQHGHAMVNETFQILYTPQDATKRATLQDLKSQPEWNREIARLVALKDRAPSSFMITGPKSSGKSTFSKILTNRLLTNIHAHVKKQSNSGVVVLDLDPGQPEYCGVGHIALVLVTKPVLSPSFCRPLDTTGIRTIRSHALASLSPASDPSLYAEMALDLITHYRNGFGSYSLIINTPGWIQGTGLDLLVRLVSELRPSEVIYMSRTGPADAVEALEGACTTTSFSTLPSQRSQMSLRTAADLRSMQTMAYFHTEPTSWSGSDHKARWFPKPLTAMAPWQVRFRGSSRGIFAVLCYDFQTQPDLVADAINGTVLAAVEVESMKAFRDIGGHKSPSDGTNSGVISGSPMDLDMTDTRQDISSPLTLLQERIITLTAEGIPFIDTSHGLTLDPRYSRSLGLVLVRGIDLDKGDLHLLCPITNSQIENTQAKGSQIVLVSGKFDPPSWAYTEDLYFQSQSDGGDKNDEADLDNQPEGIEADPEGTRGDNTDPFYSSATCVPWVEVLTRNQKRGAGSKVWRVRRDLGRVGNPTP